VRPERRAEVQALLRATARHLAAKERGEEGHFGYMTIQPLDEYGSPKGKPVSILRTIQVEEK
jgi:hypothetical protein